MFKKILCNMALVVCVASFSGCIFLAAGAAGVGTAKWLSEKVTQEVNVPRERVVKAAKSVLEGMRSKVYKQTDAPDVTQLLAKDSGGKQVWIDVRPIDANNSRVDVRVGYADGESDARKILEQIVNKSKSWL